MYRIGVLHPNDVIRVDEGILYQCSLIQLSVPYCHHHQTGKV